MSSNNSLFSSISNKLSAFSITYPYAFSSDNVTKYITTSVGSEDKFNSDVTKLILEQTGSLSVDVRDKAWAYNISGNPKINRFDISYNTTNSGITAVLDNGDRIDLKLRTTEVTPADALLYKNIIDNSESGLVNGISKSQSGWIWAEINAENKDGSVLPLTMASMVVTGTPLNVAAAEISTETYNNPTGKDFVIGYGHLSNIAQRSNTDPLSTSVASKANGGLEQPKLQTKEKLTSVSVKDGTFNSLYKSAEDDTVFSPSETNYTFKIGDVVLKNIPPTHFSISELRSTDSSEVLNFMPVDIASPTSRIVLKINAVFSGRAEIDGALKRIQTQFRYVPFNIIHSYDLVNILSAEKSFSANLASNNVYKYVPVTMDEYTIYTIEGHPNSLGCTMQFSIFNFAAYFDGDVAETFQYEAAQFDDNGKLIIPKSVKHTSHLENAIHPYNFDIEKILSRNDKKFFKGEEKRNGNSEFHIDDNENNSSIVKLWKINSFQDIDMKIINSSTNDPASQVVLLANSMSLRYENVFAWNQVIGYSHACAQYIGPGLKTASLNAKVSYDHVEDISRLFKTFQELRSKDYNANYDDRYLISSAFTDFCDCNVISLSDVAVSSLPSHPGYSDVNIIFKGSPYLSNATEENNKIAQEDDYWGLQRISKSIQKSAKLMKIIEKEEKAIADDLLTTYSWVGTWAKNSGEITKLNNVYQGLADLVSAAVNGSISTYIGDNATNAKKFYESFKVINIPEVNWDAYKKFIVESANAIRSARQKDWDNSSFTTKALRTLNAPNTPNSVILPYSFLTSIKSCGDEEFKVIKKFLVELFSSYPKLFTADPKGGYGDILGLSAAINNLKGPGSSDENLKVGANIDYAISSMLVDFRFNGETINAFSKKDPPAYLSKYILIVNVPDLNSFGKELSLRILDELISSINSKAYQEYGTTADAKLIKLNENSYNIVFNSNVDGADRAATVQLKKEKVSVDKENEKIELDLNDIKFNPPFAAHRYYPYCDQFVNINPLYSTSVGSYYSSRVTDGATHFQKMLSRMRESVKGSISPSFDFKAWTKIYPKNTEPAKMVENAVSQKNPLWILEANKYSSSRKDIVEYKNPGFNTTTISGPFANVVNSQLEAYNKSQSTDLNSVNKPFSGLSDWIFVDSVNGGVYNSPGFEDIRKVIKNKQKLTLDDGNSGDKGSTGSTLTYSKIFDSALYNNAHLSGANLVKRSASSTAAMSNGVFGSEEKGFPEYNMPSESNKFYYLTKLATVLKDPTALPSTKTVQEPTPTNPISENNTQENNVTDLTSVKNKIAEIYSNLYKYAFSNTASDPNTVAGQILGYVISQSKTNVMPEDIIASAELAISQAMNTALQSYNKLVLINKNNGIGRKIPINSSLTSVPFKYYKLENLKDDPQFIGGSNTILGQYEGHKRYIYDITLIILNIFTLRMVLSTLTKDSYSDINPFYNPKLTNGNGLIPLYKKIVNGRWANLLYTLPVPDIKYESNSLFAALESAKVSLADNTKYKTAKDATSVIVSVLEKFATYVTVENAISANGLVTEEEVSEQTQGMLINQFMQSLLPTVGMENAFPTYKLYIIDPNLSDIRFYTMDNWYDFRLVKDVMVIKSKEDPAHLLKCRVAIDERFISVNTTFVKYDDDRNPIEKTDKLAPLSIANTKLDHSFYQGKVPIRVGMRICLKLGYHTDPRLIDTVFIGTITGLQGTMEKNIYELEAYGDGRELSEPSTSIAEKITGLNYGEIITKMLRSNPSVFHFGRNYGTVLEKFSKEHYLVFAFARSCVDGALKDATAIKNLLFSGNANGNGAIIATTGLGAVMAPLAFTGIAGIGVTVGSPFQFYRMYKKLRNDGVSAAAYQEASEFFDKKLTAYSANDNWFNWKTYFSGHTFDMSKAQGQIARHMYEIYKYGHDPIDQNIWAVDIWANFFNANHSTSMNINNKLTIWDLLQDVKRLYPNYALDVRPYGARSTLYLGPLNWLITRTDDPVAGMAVNFDQTSSSSLLEQGSELFKKLAETDSFYNKQRNPFPNMVEFQRTHYASSDSNIIFNGIQSTPNRGWNAVAINCGEQTYQTTANAELHPSVIRTIVKDITWTKDNAVAQQYALGLLKEGVEKMYGGTLALRGNPKIEPYDRIYIMDAINKMYGWIEVETVIHKFDMNSGFTTHITPNMVCSINSDAYKTTSQIIRSILFKEDITGYVLKTIAGIGIGAAIASISAPAVATAVAVGSVAIFLFGATSTIIDSVSQMKEIWNKALTTKEESIDLQAYLKEAVASSAGTDAAIHGMYAGFALNYVSKLGTVVWEGNLINNTRSISVDLWDTMKEKWTEKTYGEGFLAKFRVDGNESAALKRQILQMSKFIERLAKVDKDADYIKRIKDVMDKGLDYTEAEKLEGAVNAIKKGMPEIEKNIKSTITDEAKANKAIQSIKDQLKVAEERLAIVKKNVIELGKVQANIPNGNTGKLGKTQVAKGASKLAKGLFTMSFVQLLLDTVEAFPRWMESYMVNYMTKANCITISPLYSKNMLMTAGLDGWQHTNAWLHLKGLVLNAKKVLSDVDTSLNYLKPTPLVADANLNDATQKAVGEAAKNVKNKNVAAASKVTDWKKQIDSAISKAKGKIKTECGKDLLTPEFVMSIMYEESRGDQNAGRTSHAVYVKSDCENYGKNCGGGIGLMQLTIRDQGPGFYQTAKSMGRTNITNEIDQNGGVANRQKHRPIWIKLMCENPDVNIQRGVDFIVEKINENTANNGGKCTPNTMWNVAKKYNADEEHYSKNGLRMDIDYANRVVGNISSLKNAINTSSSAYTQGAISSSVLNTATSQLVNGKLSSITNAVVSSADIARYFNGALNNRDTGVVAVRLPNSNISTINTNIKNGTVIVAEQTSRDNTTSTVAYTVVNNMKNGTIVLTDTNKNTITLGNIGSSNQWSIKSVTSSNGTQSINPPNDTLKIVGYMTYNASRKVNITSANTIRG